MKVRLTCENVLLCDRRYFIYTLILHIHIYINNNIYEYILIYIRVRRREKVFFYN